MEHRPSNAPEVHDHEHTDVPVRTIGRFMLMLVVGGVVTVLVLGGLWNLFQESIPEEARLPAWSGPRELPPSPRLQIRPSADLSEYLREESERLNSYGWVDRSTGKVHIPIEEAMDRVVKAGLPARQTAQSNPEAAGQASGQNQAR